MDDERRRRSEERAWNVVVGEIFLLGTRAPFRLLKVAAFTAGIGGLAATARQELDAGLSATDWALAAFFSIFGVLYVGYVLLMLYTLASDEEDSGNWKADLALLLVLGAWVVALVGGGVLASVAEVSWRTGIQQVLWEYLDAVPTLKLTDGWTRPIAQGASTGAEAVLIVVRALSLLVLIRALQVLIRHLRKRRERPETAVNEEAPAENSGESEADRQG